MVQQCGWDSGERRHFPTTSTLQSLLLVLVFVFLPPPCPDTDSGVLCSASRWTGRRPRPGCRWTAPCRRCSGRGPAPPPASSSWPTSAGTGSGCSPTNETTRLWRPSATSRPGSTSVSGRRPSGTGRNCSSLSGINGKAHFVGVPSAGALECRKK